MVAMKPRSPSAKRVGRGGIMHPAPLNFGWRASSQGCVSLRGRGESQSFLWRSAPVHRHIGALRRAGIKLARAADLLGRVGNHFVPLRDPTDGAGEGEEDGEHRRRETDRRQDDARIEIDVREDRKSTRLNSSY